MTISFPRDANRIPVIGGVSSVDGITPVLPYVDPTTHRLKVDLAGTGTGTVTSVSIISANGISGTVTNSTTTPAITLTISGLDATNIADGSVTNTIFQFLDGVTSNIQTQLNAKGTGTVTAVSITSANGFSGSSSGGATPSLTIVAGALTPTSIAASGTVTGSNLSGTNTGDQTNITGNAGTATKLQTARTINGVSFDGTANITIPAGLSRVNTTGTSQSMAIDTLYIANNASNIITFTLPVTAIVGSIVGVTGNGSGGWEILQNSGQSIQIGNQITTIGTGGSLVPTNQYDCIQLMCTVANTTWVMMSSVTAKFFVN